MHEGEIIWTGAVAADGCGFVIQTGGYTFHPLNLPSEYEQDSLKVWVDLRFSEERFFCGIIPESLVSVEVKQIRAR